MTAEGWQSALGDILDAVALEDDTFALDLRTVKGADGAPIKDCLPREALQTEGDDLDAWWTDTDAPQSDVWMHHGWVVLRADPERMTVAFARLYGGQPGGGR